MASFLQLDAEPQAQRLGWDYYGVIALAELRASSCRTLSASQVAALLPSLAWRSASDA